MHWFVEAFRKYAVFSGRARRMEYWMFHFFNWIVWLFLLVVVFPAGEELNDFIVALFVLYAFAIILPSLAVAVRRMHDTDHSGWWILVPVANFVFALIEGTPGPNRFGPDPKAEPEFA
jgi:uncharacterized membrane protein YhaH (DUF805 family)